MINQIVYSEEGFQLLCTISGEKEGDGPKKVCGVGDVNGDGLNDIAIGACNGNYVKLYFGGSPFDTLNYLRFASDDPFAKFGYSITGGDFNCDGFSDLVVGAFAYSLDEYYLGGRVYIYYGSANMDTIPDLIIKGQGWGYWCGKAVANGGDINGDGYNDLVVGVPTYYYTCGRVYIYFGGSQMNNLYDVFIRGDTCDMIGEAIDGVGDVNQDGFDDILIGAPGCNGRLGRAYLVFGGSNIGLENAKVFEGDFAYGSFGKYVAGLGDINGDGYNDFGVASDKYLKIFSGNAFNLILKMQAPSKWGTFYGINSANNINYDGYSDFMISLWDSLSLYHGRIALYLGSNSIDTIPEYNIMGLGNGFFGFSIDIAGDVNNDGKQEIIISEQSVYVTEKVGAGKVYIYTFNKTDDLTKRDFKTLSQNFKLCQNHPNPFNYQTTIEFILSYSTRAFLDILDIKGRIVINCFDSEFTKGTYVYTWDGKDDSGKTVPCGIYFCRLSVMSGAKTQTRVIKMLFMK